MQRRCSVLCICFLVLATVINLYTQQNLVAATIYKQGVKTLETVRHRPGKNQTGWIFASENNAAVAQTLATHLVS